ncbi:MBL fold metallo-hydrolase [Pontibacillus sp. HMF3514]|uniref:MBL fold metallo-hydrolase n=1 Tax=Pontibacillus sp. HMF3514 TaxID=2692425 RepID=UPI00131FB889|nr:MBL fold metallo-hydrolase [Pontibacillus sp. HMF3514]QHE51367.1 MBL fold metallo-hydrolase [Pontibacillus sp. HMF3514]
MKVTVNGFWGGYPGAYGATSSYIVESNGFTLLVDCGSGALSRLQPKMDVMDIGAVIISHYHFDHIADIGVMQYAWKVQNILRETERQLPIYGHQEDMESFQALTHERTQGYAYDPTKPIQIGPFTIRFMKTDHPVPCYAMRISNGYKDIVYTADSSYKEEFIEFSKGADLLITDSNFYDGMDGSGPGHMTSTECAHIAKEAGVKELWLSHLPHFGTVSDLQEQAEQVFDGTVMLADGGLTWEV